MNKMLLILASVCIAGQAYAGGDAARGQAKSAACAACHGADGNSAVPTFPKLAGQNEDYLVHALKSYKNGSRKNDVMKGMAAPLSEQDIADLSAYFAKQSGLVVKR